MEDKYFNGYRYKPVAKPDAEELAKINAVRNLSGTVVTRISDRPAIILDGIVYYQAEQLLPGLFKGGRK